MQLLAHAPSQFMMLLGKMHLLSVPLAVASIVLLGCPGRRSLAKWLAITALVTSLPVLLVIPFLPAMLGRDAAGAIALLFVTPFISTGALMALTTRVKK